MPIYEYQCTACGHQLEALQKMSDEPLTVCPKCNQPQLSKLVSAAGFQLKGSGWYVTDYSKKGQSRSTADKASESAGEVKSAETAKPAASESSSGSNSTNQSGGSSA